MQRAIRQAKGGFQQWPGLQVTSLLKGLDLSEASFQSSIPRLQLSPSLQLTWIHRFKALTALSSLHKEGEMQKSEWSNGS